MDILFILFCVGISFFLGWYLSFHKFARKEKYYLEKINLLEKEKNEYNSQIVIINERNAFFEKEIDITKTELNLKRELVLELNKKLSFLESDYKNLQEKILFQKEEVEKLQEKFAFEFKNLANDIFEEKSKRFTDQNKTNISELLTPLKDRIVEFERKIETNNKDTITWNTSLKEQITGLKELNLQITREAENLVKALKGESKTQGNWGEFILENILEKSGLVKDREYVIQESFKSEDGKRYQPDVIIKLPEGKNIIIDAKVSLTAYERYCNSESDDEKMLGLKNHLLSIKNHIKNLGDKNYQKLYGVKSLDFILLFIPIEPALSLAIQQDNNLFNQAFDRNIVIVSPSTLLATLRTISSIWRQENQNRNALEIAKQSGDLYDKFVGFVQDMSDLGMRISSVRDVYDKAMNKLSEGRGNLISRAEKIKNLGAGTTKVLPQELIEKSDHPE